MSEPSLAPASCRTVTYRPVADDTSFFAAFDLCAVAICCLVMFLAGLGTTTWVQS